MKRSQDVDFDALFDSLHTDGDDATSPAEDGDDSADDGWDDAEDE